MFYGSDIVDYETQQNNMRSQKNSDIVIRKIFIVPQLVDYGPR